MSVIWVFKPIGWTPKDCVLECQKTIEKKMLFAGRLDPMAYGLLPLIANNTNDSVGNKEVQILKDSLQGSYKTYKFNLIIGLESDTFDILGMVQKRNNVPNFDLEEIKMMKTQTYPPYSSYCVFDESSKRKVPMWKLAKEGRLPDILPEREIDIEYIKILSSNVVNNNELRHIIDIRIASLRDKLNYRNEETKARWDGLLREDCNFLVYNLEAKVSTGTYIRTIGDLLGGVVYDICRTSVNAFVLENIDKYDKFEFIIVEK